MNAADTQARRENQMTTKAKKANKASSKKVAAHAQEKKAAEEKQAKKPEVAKAPVPVRERDPRLPPVGTVLRKVDRHGATRCEATVEADGFRYDGTLYKSLSGAAMAAAKDLGLGDTAQNGFVFWSLVKPAARASDPIAALEHAWGRFHAKAAGLFASTSDEAVRAKLQAAVAGQAKKLGQLAGD